MGRSVLEFSGFIDQRSPKKAFHRVRPPDRFGSKDRVLRKTGIRVWAEQVLRPMPGSIPETAAGKKEKKPSWEKQDLAWSHRPPLNKIGRANTNDSDEIEIPLVPRRGVKNLSGSADIPKLSNC